MALFMPSLNGGIIYTLFLKGSFFDTGWAIDEASSENLASFNQILCQHAIFWAIKSEILHAATAQLRTQLGVSPERHKHTPTKLFVQAPEHPFSHRAPLLKKFRRCLHEAHVWRASFCAFHSMLAHWSKTIISGSYESRGWDQELMTLLGGLWIGHIDAQVFECEVSSLWRDWWHIRRAAAFHSDAATLYFCERETWFLPLVSLFLFLSLVLGLY